MELKCVPDNLTAEECKIWKCRDLLPLPGGEVVEKLLIIIGNFRGQMGRYESELVEYAYEND
jgi:hypothetical protein